MKLLTPIQSKDLKSQELARNVIRSQEIAEAEKTIRQKLVNAEADFNQSLADHRNKWALEEEEHADRLKDMVKEIKALEKRKEKALIPIDMYKNEADALYKEAKSALDRALERESLAESTLEKLEERLDEVGEREMNLTDNEHKLLIERQGLESQKASTAEGSSKLTQQIADFSLKYQQLSNELNDRKEALFLKETNLEAREEMLERSTESLKDWKVKLDDERRTLQSGWNELENNLNK